VVPCILIPGPQVDLIVYSHWLSGETVAASSHELVR
jgi:hypothetical protein